MAVAFDTSSESHTGTTGNSGASSFSWSHGGGATARAAVVFVYTQPVATDITSSVIYGGTTMTAVSGGFAADTATEPGSVKAYFLDAVSTGTQTVTVNRTSNSTVMYAVAATVTSPNPTMTAGVTLQQENQAPAQANVDDGSPAAASVRFAGAYYGGASPPIVGGSSTSMQSIDFTALAVGSVRETTAGTGSRPIGFADGSDDWACVLLAVREYVVSAKAGFGTENRVA